MVPDVVGVLALLIYATEALSTIPVLVPGRHSTSSFVASRSQQHATFLRLSRSDEDGPPATFPVSRRALIEKAQKIDPALVDGERKGSYSSVGWSNRLGTVLTPASLPGVYTADRPFYWNRIDVGCRMAIIELSTTTSTNEKPDLFLHSPVPLDDRLAQAINDLGNVKHVVSPNYEHVKYAKQWADSYPDAYIWGCPGMMEREPQVRWTGELPYGCRPPSYPLHDKDNDNDVSMSSSSSSKLPFWDFDEIQPLHFDVEENPFTGRPFFNEVVFYHTKSKTLLTTDTYWNYPSGDGITNNNYAGLLGSKGSPVLDDDDKEEDFGVWDLAPEVGTLPFGTRLWKVGMDKVYRPFYLNLMVKKDKREEFQEIGEFICGIMDGQQQPKVQGSQIGWEVETVIPAHGDIVRGKTLVRNILKEHFNV